jgi:DNA-binding NarL/FixJ family response regulator
MESTKVLLVDDHAILRELLGERLASKASIQVVGSVGNPDEAIDAALAKSPDVIVMDIDMPGRNVFDAARVISSRLPRVRILFLTAFLHDRYIEQAIAVGARGFLTKTGSPDQLVQAVREVAAGRTFYAPEVMDRIVVTDGSVALAPERVTKASTLSPREMEVLRYLARGQSKRDISEAMHLSIKTVQRHTERIMAKLDIHDRVELARFAIREGLAEA